MEAIASPHTTRVLGLALQCISKIGAYVLFEGSHKGIVLRSLNDSKSSFCAFYFSPEAFQSFHCPPRGKPVKCQFLVKAIQHVFRNLKGLECLRIYFGGSTQTQREGAARSEENSEDINTLILEAKCSHQILKRYSIACEDCELFRAVVNRDECPNCLGRKPQGLARMIECVPIADEVCCGIANEKLYFKSIYGNASDAVASHGHLESAMSIPLNEFHRCELGMSSLSLFRCCSW
eukprot:gb/GECG01000095.1/.p1 GENE.gb/GECG01000095.1/~~gb/GECG01000095.1/.p1  ORF type:complete len:235 (+),score=13.71 gb/GECG01000095.1/:1-705(+)